MGHKTLSNTIREVKRYEKAWLDLERYLVTFKRLNSIVVRVEAEYRKFKKVNWVSNWRPDMNDLVKKTGHKGKVE